MVDDVFSILFLWQILKAYTASQVLERLGEGPVPVTLIRDALHKAFPVRKDQ